MWASTTSWSTFIPFSLSIIVKLGGQSKVSNLHLHIFIDEQVAEFEITMDDLALMEVVTSLYDLTDEVATLGLCHGSSSVCATPSATGGERGLDSDERILAESSRKLLCFLFKFACIFGGHDLKENICLRIFCPAESFIFCSEAESKFCIVYRLVSKTWIKILFMFQSPLRNLNVSKLVYTPDVCTAPRECKHSRCLRRNHWSLRCACGSDFGGYWSLESSVRKKQYEYSISFRLCLTMSHTTSQYRLYSRVKKISLIPYLSDEALWVVLWLQFSQRTPPWSPYSSVRNISQNHPKSRVLRKSSQFHYSLLCTIILSGPMIRGLTISSQLGYCK